MYNYYQPQQATIRQSVTPQIGLKGRPVSSLEEVKAAAIDFDGSIFFFPDLANKRIFTKQINIDGTSSLYMYELKEFPVVENNNITNENFVTREEFTATIQQLQDLLTRQQSTNSKGGNENEYKF